MNSLREEWNLMLQGKYIQRALITPLILALVFGYLFSQSQLNESKIVVIDEDNSLYSQQLINKINASQYADVMAVLHEDIDPKTLLYSEKYMAVLYLPHGLEENRYQGKPSNVGLLVDYTVPSATANLRAGVSEVLGYENSSAPALGKLKAIGMNDEQINGTLSSITLQQRLLFNPTNSLVNLLVIGYVTIVSLGNLYKATISIVARMREENRLIEELKRPVGLLLRVVPYAGVFFVSMVVMIGALKQFGGLRFDGNVLEFMLPLSLFCITNAWFAMLVGWNAATQTKAENRVQLLVSPAFLLSGVLSPIMLFPSYVQMLSNTIPATWYFKLFRGMGLRGGGLEYFMEDIAAFLIMISIVLVLLTLLIVRENRKANAASKPLLQLPLKTEASNNMTV
ncbi:ABC transporter permease [Paenibacillus radicis (ex Xue et al. 2023)]|uniref:ABC transporter permease n=1 Tax=Paenibacillus radicis (ex Xue et al. 2023) TaxID=2972489 RepID=A0ABT1YIX4_9BACL|nr:ABC transporter permease [Paenibacillus radicis (ex Xue et al. 2023)]MCR8633146.1 ABC transporter permease [Paenibacillus radicis (ex Xue et al. 2023)]